MDSASAIALSGVRAAEKRIAVAADNIANAQSEDFKAKKVEQTPERSGGVRAEVVERNPATETVPGSDGQVVQRPAVDLATELVQVSVAANDVRANFEVIKAQDDLNKRLLDIQA